MNFLNDGDQINLDLPETTAIDRNLFPKDVTDPSVISETEFDVDEFLMKNNFHYTQLDPLIRDMSSLSADIMSDLLEQVSSNYEHYLQFFKTYTSEDNEIMLQVQEIKNKLDTYMSGFETLTKNEINSSKEVIADTVEYLRKLDDISIQLATHEELAKDVVLSKELSKSLHSLCGIEEADELLCADLVKQLNELISKSENLLSSLESINSPYIHHYYNEYQGIIQEFQVSLKILTDKCLADPKAYPTLALSLVTLIK